MIPYTNHSGDRNVWVNMFLKINLRWTVAPPRCLNNCNIIKKKNTFFALVAQSGLSSSCIFVVKSCKSNTFLRSFLPRAMSMINSSLDWLNWISLHMQLSYRFNEIRPFGFTIDIGSTIMDARMRNQSISQTDRLILEHHTESTCVL